MFGTNTKMDNVEEMNNDDHSIAVQSTSKRKKMSVVWNFYTQEESGEGAKCNICKTRICTGYCGGKANFMRTQRTELSRGFHSRKRRFRRTSNRLHNKRKHSRVYHRMNADRNLSNLAQSSDVISLLDDDDNIASQSPAGRLHGAREDVQKVLQQVERGHQHKFGWRCDHKVKELLATSIVDLSNDQEQAVCSPQATRMRRRKQKSTIMCGEEIIEYKKLKVNMPQTVSDARDEIKILGLDTGVIPLVQATANGVVPQENDVFLVSQNSFSVKTKQAIPACSSESIKDESTNPDSTKSVTEEQRTNESVIIVDSDDDSPIVERPRSGRDYIPLVQKQLDASVEILEHTSKVPQSPELLVVKHIAPPSNMSTRQKNEDVVMFEDRTGSFEQFYSADFWKKLKKQNAQRLFKKQNAGQVVDVQQLPEPVKKRDDSNIYNPTPVLEKGGLRPVVIDGNNVAWGHGNHKYFSAPGLEICINYFVQRKHRVIAFVPQHRKTRKVPGLIDMLDKYEKLGQIVMTPSRKIDGKTVSSYDDRYIVQAATELGGVIVSTDNYRDLMAENQRWKETIEKRLLMFTWVGDMLMFPQDPLGRDGPTLEEFLRFPE